MLLDRAVLSAHSYEARVLGSDAAPRGSSGNERKLLLCPNLCGPALEMAAFRPSPRCGLDFIGAALKDYKFSEFEKDCVCNLGPGASCEICFFLMDTNVVFKSRKQTPLWWASAVGPQEFTWRCCHSAAIDLGACPSSWGPAGAHTGEREQREGLGEPGKTGILPKST